MCQWLAAYPTYMPILYVCIYQMNVIDEYGLTNKVGYYKVIQRYFMLIIKIKFRSSLSIVLYVNLFYEGI